MNQGRDHRFQRGNGFSLIEVVFALGLCSFVLIALLGLILAGMRQDRDSRDAMGAMLAANRILEDYRAVASGSNTVPNFPLPPNLAVASANDSDSPIYIDDRGGRTTSRASAAFGVLYRVLPSFPAPVTSSKVYLHFFWPASAAVASAKGHYEVITTLPLTSSFSN